MAEIDELTKRVRRLERMLDDMNIASFPGQHVDAFSRLRTSEPGYRFDAQLTYQIDADLWDTKVTGTGTVGHDGTERMAVLTAPASGSNTAVLQSYYHAPYTPGRGQLVFVTFTMGAAPGASGYKRAGYWDGTNGIYLERTSTVTNLVLASATSKGTETVAQAFWNIDPMDGTGPSGITLDLTKTQILVVQIQALYVGQVVVGFDIGGELVPVHAFRCANEEEDPYIQQASLPVRYEVVAAAGTGTDVVLHAVCASVISEGGPELVAIPGREFAAYGTNTDVDATSEAVLAIQCKEQLNGIDQHALVIPLSVFAEAEGSGCWVEVRRNATIATGSFTSVDANSTVEWADAATGSLTASGGVLIDAFFLPASNQIRSADSAGVAGKAVLCYSHLLGTADNLTVFALGGTNSTVRAALKWKEVR